MADKTFPVVQLVAVERGFVGGCMVEAGEKFQFDTTPVKGSKLAEDGSRRIPKWAAVQGDPRLTKPKPEVGDLKPKAAQAAVANKAKAAQGT